MYVSNIILNRDAAFRYVSFIYDGNSVGYNIVPCGTPDCDELLCSICSRDNSYSTLYVTYVHRMICREGSGGGDYERL